MKPISIIALFLTLAGAVKRLSAAVVFVDIENITLGNPTEYVYRDLDLNSDGIADLTFQTGRSDLVCFSTVSGGIAGIPTVPPNQNHFAAAFLSGEILGISFPTESLYRWNEGYSGLLSCRDAGCLGLWEDKTAYLGVQFSSAVGIHYGWVEVFVFGNTSTGSILSFAYESEPRVPIVAGVIPESSSFVLAAAGLAGGFLRRRRI
ncbi:MAG: motif protein [Verrucomicrobiales bacterium]|nr:motif protein [Verrucomicrobiales bacterium]